MWQCGNHFQLNPIGLANRSQPLRIDSRSAHPRQRIIGGNTVAAESLVTQDETEASEVQQNLTAASQIRDRIREFRRVRAGSVLDNPRNWRRHSKSQAAALRGLLKEIGFASALLVRELADGRLMLIDGHLRAHTAPDMEMPVLILDVTEEEADKLLATLDPLAAMAESDSERLKNLLQRVKTDSSAVEELLRCTAGPPLWAILHPGEIVEAEVSTERADELRGKWQTASGQLWQVGSHQVVCGDCTDPATVARLWQDHAACFRMIWCDPPYGTNYGEKTEWISKHGEGAARRQIVNDSLEPDQLQKLFATALRVAAGHALPGASIYATVPSTLLKFFIQGLEDGGFRYHHCLVWVKQAFVVGRSDYHYRHEPILYGWLEHGPHFFTDDRTQDSVFEVDRPMVSELHPTTKPVELIARMIRNSSRPDELVYDAFCGSGSTIVAAHQLGRIGYGCEIDPAYVAVTLERLALLGLKPELLQS
jgi:DNA modification methylase